MITMTCELCESQPAVRVSGDGMCLCEPCAGALAVTKEEARAGTIVTSGLSDVTLPGLLIPPLGIAQALGVPDIARRIGSGGRSHYPSTGQAMVPPPAPPAPSGDGLANVAKIVAIGAGVVAIGAIGYKFIKSVKRPAVGRST